MSLNNSNLDSVPHPGTPSVSVSDATAPAVEVEKSDKSSRKSEANQRASAPPENSTAIQELQSHKASENTDILDHVGPDPSNSRIGDGNAEKQHSTPARSQANRQSPLSIDELQVDRLDSRAELLSGSDQVQYLDRIWQYCFPDPDQRQAWRSCFAELTNGATPSPWDLPAWAKVFAGPSKAREYAIRTSNLQEAIRLVMSDYQAQEELFRQKQQQLQIGEWERRPSREARLRQLRRQFYHHQDRVRQERLAFKRQRKEERKRLKEVLRLHEQNCLQRQMQQQEYFRQQEIQMQELRKQEMLKQEIHKQEFHNQREQQHEVVSEAMVMAVNEDSLAQEEGQSYHHQPTDGGRVDQKPSILEQQRQHSENSQMYQETEMELDDYVDELDSLADTDDGVAEEITEQFSASKIDPDARDGVHESQGQLAATYPSWAKKPVATRNTAQTQEGTSSSPSTTQQPEASTLAEQVSHSITHLMGTQYVTQVQAEAGPSQATMNMAPNAITDPEFSIGQTPPPVLDSILKEDGKLKQHQEQQQEQQTAASDEAELDLIQSFTMNMPTTIPERETFQVSIPLGDVVARTLQEAKEQDYMSGESRTDQMNQLKILSEKCMTSIQNAMQDKSLVADSSVALEIKSCLETSFGIVCAMDWNLTVTETQKLGWTSELLGRLVGRVLWYSGEPELNAKLNAGIYKEIMKAAAGVHSKLPDANQTNNAAFQDSKERASLPASNVNMEDLFGGMNTDLERAENVRKLHDLWINMKRYIDIMKSGDIDVVFRNYEDLGEHIAECNKILAKVEDMTPREYAESGWDIDHLELLDFALWDVFSLKGNKTTVFDGLDAWDGFQTVAGTVTWVRELLCQANGIDCDLHVSTDQSR
ncbi:hypothetical protein K491DRAFT_140914 [Lophiostoma macrostomum CBS 122681]|uniref:Uncharacterized protein n=1 Tax=Lophiostoma macrostomum CBS 122681 TaxID=1314788 RepID=A0A6A6SRA5_9PLEO|nr:hypothetical protein K491DRAFT_140914 [Lophiostoma macrostomum CBS 122681]